jgi:hypothetical protein
MKILLLCILLLAFIGCSSPLSATQVDQTQDALVVIPPITNVSDIVLTQKDQADLGVVCQNPCTMQESTPVGAYVENKYTIVETSSNVTIFIQKWTDWERMIVALHTYSRVSSNSTVLSEYLALYEDIHRFQTWNESDIVVYDLWFTRDQFLLHVQSRGVSADRAHVESMTHLIVEKFHDTKIFLN